MNQTPLVTYILPTYNRPKLLPLAIVSFLAQTYPNKELVVIDDSEPSCEKIVKQFNADNIKYYRCPDKYTIGRKRNIGCELATGELIAHWDDDDWYHPDRVAEQVAYLQKNNLACTAYYTAFFYNPSLHKAFQYYEDTTTIIGSSFIYNKAIWKRNRFLDMPIGEDTYFYQRIPHHLISGTPGLNRLVVIEHGDNITKRDTDKMLTRYPQVRESDVLKVMSQFDPAFEYKHMFKKTKSQWKKIDWINNSEAV